MAYLIAWNEQDATDTAKLMQRAAEYVSKDFSLHDIEQLTLINQFCELRDHIKIKPLEGK